MIWRMTSQIKYLNSQMIQKCSELYKTDADKDMLQNHLTKLVKWSEKWQMLFKFLEML